MYEKYANGTIKVKNSNGELIPFYPNSTSDNVLYDDQTLTDKIWGVNQRVENASQKPTIKVMYEEPSSGNTYAYPNKTMFAWIDFPEVPSDTWQIVVDTRLYNNTGTNAISAIPFNLYGQSVTLTVDWGDGTTSTLNSSNYTNTDSRASQHTYSTPGEYTIKIKSSNWSYTYFNSIIQESNWASTYNNKLGYLKYFRNTLIQIESPIPNTSGIKYFSTAGGSFITKSNALMYIFSYCIRLKLIISTLFKNCTNVTTFTNAFTGCSSLISIPEDLFRYNTAVTDFEMCFYKCYALSSIPKNLFKYNTAVTRLSLCFYECSNLNNFTLNIGSSLIFSATAFVPVKNTSNSETRIVYVPTNTETYTAFNNESSNLKITVIGE